MKMRNVDNPTFQLPEMFSKNFTMDRNYNVVWDLSKGIKLDYTARIRMRVDELPGSNSVDSVKSFLLDNIRAGGRPVEYHHTVNTSWNIPINKLPLMDFAQLQLRYTADYDWKANSLLASRQSIDSLDYGNIIENSGKWNGTANLNFATFYKNFSWYKKLKQGGNSKSRGARTAMEQRLIGNNSKNTKNKEDEKLSLIHI